MGCLLGSGQSSQLIKISPCCTHVADEGGFDLSRYPAILDWLGRIQSLDGYIGMEV